MKINKNSSLSGIGITTTWDGTSWNNGVPNKNIIAVIEGVYNTGTHGSFSCLDLFLNTGSLTITINNRVNVYRNIQQQVGFVLNVVNGELALFDEDVDTTSVKLTISRTLEYTYQRLDFRQLGDPISNKTVASLAPGTLANRIYNYNAIANAYETNYFFNATTIGVDVANSIFKPGVGFLIRTSNGFPTSPTAWTISSNNLSNSGILNSGVIKLPFQFSPTSPDKFVLISNPYSASIDIKKFLNKNSFIQPDYCTISLKTNAAPCTTNQLLNIYRSNISLSGFPYIKPFTAFFIILSNDVDLSSQEITFTPDMMVLDEPFDLFSSITLTMFQSGVNLPVGYLTYTLYKHPSNITSLNKTAFYANLTLSNTGVRLLTNNPNSSTKSSMISTNEDLKEIPLYLAGTSATIQIQLTSIKGLYNNRDIILVDKDLNIEHDLKVSSYSFLSANVNYEDRFYIKIQ